MAVDNWTANWLIKNVLSKEQCLDSSELISPNYLKVVRDRGDEVYISTLPGPHISIEDVRAILAGIDGPLHFLLSIKPDIRIDEDSIALLDASCIAFGTVSELRRALVLDLPHSYINQTVKVISRMLKQHKSVSAYERADQNTWRITQRSQSVVVVVSLSDYEITAEAVRSAYELHPELDVILKSNSLGGISSDAHDIAKGQGGKILSWKEFMRDLGSL